MTSAEEKFNDQMEQVNHSVDVSQTLENHSFLANKGVMTAGMEVMFLLSFRNF